MKVRDERHSNNQCNNSRLVPTFHPCVGTKVGSGLLQSRAEAKEREAREKFNALSEEEKLEFEKAHQEALQKAYEEKLKKQKALLEQRKAKEEAVLKQQVVKDNRGTATKGI